MVQMDNVGKENWLKPSTKSYDALAYFDTKWQWSKCQALPTKEKLRLPFVFLTAKEYHHFYGLAGRNLPLGCLKNIGVCCSFDTELV